MEIKLLCVSLHAKYDERYKTNEKMKKVIVLLMMLVVRATMHAQGLAVDNSKIVVLSDIHVMAPELLIKEGPAWTAYLDEERRLQDYSKALFDAMVTRLKDDIRPGLVLITGDLTKDGETVSHEYVVAKLDELRAAGIHTLVVPGNHDYGPNGNAVYYDGSSTTAAAVASTESFATMYANYGYGASSERAGETLTYACEPIEGLVVIGIDSGREGVLSEATLSWVCNKAQTSQQQGKQVVAMMHYPLIPHFTGAETFSESVSVVDYARVRNTLADAGIQVIFTGHFHTTDIAKDYNADCSKSIIDVNTGSLISYPCHYRVVTLDQQLSALNITTQSVAEIVPGDGFADIAKARLTTAARTKVESKGLPFSMMASQIAAAFVYHAEGDEYDNTAAQALLGTLSPFLSGDYRMMAYSMLQDYSNYGDEKRQDRTPDLTLTITMPTPTGIVSLQRDDHRHSAVDLQHLYDLHGVKAKSPSKGLYISNGRKVVISR